MPGSFLPAGRPPGTIGKKTYKLEERIRVFMLTQFGKEDYCPILANLERIYGKKPNGEPYELSDVQKLEAEFRVAEFLYPKLKAVDVNVNEQVDVRLDVVHRIVERIKSRVIESGSVTIEQIEEDDGPDRADGV